MILLITRNQLSEKISGSSNPHFGKAFYIDKDYKGKSPTMSVLAKSHRFKIGEQPENWIRFSEWRDLQKNKSHFAYGRKWYNNGEINFLLYPDDEKCTNLKKGRILKTN